MTTETNNSQTASIEERLTAIEKAIEQLTEAIERQHAEDRENLSKALYQLRVLLSRIGN